MEDFLNDNKGRSTAKQGRRAARLPEPTLDDEDPMSNEPAENLADISETRPGRRDADAPPKPNRRMGGWGEEKRSGFDSEDARLRPHSPDDGSDSDNDIPVIPDLEDQQEEDMTSTVAMAPNVAINRLAAYRELDNDLLRHAQFLTLDNEIDLKLLAKCMSSEADVNEEDKPWDWDRLFTEVSSELLTEWERTETTEEETDTPA